METLATSIGQTPGCTCVQVRGTGNVEIEIAYCYDSPEHIIPTEKRRLDTQITNAINEVIVAQLIARGFRNVPFSPFVQNLCSDFFDGIAVEMVDSVISSVDFDLTMKYGLDFKGINIRVLGNFRQHVPSITIGPESIPELRKFLCV